MEAEAVTPGADELNRYLQRVTGSAGFRCWCFGHHHAGPDDLGDARFRALFDRT